MPTLHQKKLSSHIQQQYFPERNGHVHMPATFTEDPTVDVVMPVRGGYGISRLLDAIDYEAIARHNPICCGFSDFTAFNLAYLAHTGKVSYQGPTGVSFAASVPDFTETSFLNAVTDTVWQVHFETTSDETLNLEGCLWGGNLSMMVSLLGTPHFPKIKGGLLYLEDVHERAYRVERMLLQLDMAGVLRQQKAIILGAQLASIRQMSGSTGMIFHP